MLLSEPTNQNAACNSGFFCFFLLLHTKCCLHPPQGWMWRWTLCTRGQWCPIWCVTLRWCLWCSRCSPYSWKHRKRERRPPSTAQWLRNCTPSWENTSGRMYMTRCIPCFQNYRHPIVFKGIWNQVILYPLCVFVTGWKEGFFILYNHLSVLFLKG